MTKQNHTLLITTILILLLGIITKNTYMLLAGVLSYIITWINMQERYNGRKRKGDNS